MVTSFLINAAVLSALYALVAIGFTLIFGVGRVFNFAHGAFMLTGAYTAYLVTSSSQLGLPAWLGFPAGMLTAGLLASGIYLVMVQRVKDRPITILLATLLVGFIVQHTVRVVYGVGSFSIPQPVDGGIGGVRTFQIFVFVSSWIVISLVLYGVNYTEFGKSIVATSQNLRGAQLAGIDTDRINLYTWAIAGVLAGFAGILLAQFQTGGWQMGLLPMVIAFSIVILGGLGSIKGSIIGAYVVGTIETAMTSLINPRLTGIASLVLLVVVLLIKPEGLFGQDIEF
jgi:branched-chain amino acid transport system permease protein